MNKSGRKKSSLNAIKKLNKSSKPLSALNEVAAEFDVLENPVKSYSDKKEYRVIRLKNGLTACLISDAGEYTDSDSDSESESDSSAAESSGSWETESESESDNSEEGDDSRGKSKKSQGDVKLAAAALCVGVGSFSDPKEIPGLAHFLEHMVFMGSEKFPQENDFDAYITKHGGSDNGSTDFETTTFYFECFDKHFFNALDKFAQFFISPLMKRDSLSREREAVESEFQMAVPSDEHRVEQLLMGLALQSSPVNSFSWGNLVSLRDNVAEETLYEKLHEFRKRHYSAHRMTVAVQARLSLDVLESYVVNCFSNVPNNNLPKDDFSGYNETVFDTPAFNKIYYVKPAKEVNQVILTWVMPSLLHMYKSKPEEYVSWLLGHEGQGSLLSYLKKQLWSFSLEAGTNTSGADFNSMYMSFAMTITLTKEGYEQLDKVIEAVFSYIKLLRNFGPSERIFKEIQTIQEVSFRFDEEENPSDIVEAIAENMQIYPPEDYLTGSELLFEYAPDEITKVLNYLTPNKMNIVVVCSTVKDSIVYDKIEPWFKTLYTEKEIPSAWMNSWNEAETLSGLYLPAPNEFITEDFSIISKVKNNPDYPQKVMETPLIELWYKKDQTFGFPVAYYYYYLFCPYSVKSIENVCMMEIFVFILNMNLMEDGYPAILADLSYSVTTWERGLCIKFTGYNEKLPKLIKLVAKHLKECGDSFNEILFESAKTKQQQNLYNVLLKPSKLCNDVRSCILQRDYFLFVEKYSKIKEITYNMMKEFTKNVLNQLYTQGLIQGNLTKDVALESTKILLDELNYQPIASMDLLKVSVNEIPKGEHCCRIYSLNKENKNSTITNYYQCGPLTIKDTVILEFILLLLEEPLFDTLRTKEQLGYSVFTTVRDTYGILGYSVTVHTQANKYSTRHVDNRIEEFINSSQKILKKMTNKQFCEAKESLSKLKMVVDVDLEDEVDRNWDEIFSRKYLFNRLLEEIKAIQKLKASDVSKWWDTYNIYNKKSDCRKLTVQVVGHDKSDVDNVIYLDVEEQAELNLKDGVHLLDKEGTVKEEKVVVSNDLKVVSISEAPNCKLNIPKTNATITIDGPALYFVEDETELLDRKLEPGYFIKDVAKFKEKLKIFS